MIVGDLEGCGDRVAVGVLVFVGSGVEVAVTSGAGVREGVEVRPEVAEGCCAEGVTVLRGPPLANWQAVKLTNNSDRTIHRICFNTLSLDI